MKKITLPSIVFLVVLGCCTSKIQSENVSKTSPEPEKQSKSILLNGKLEHEGLYQYQDSGFFATIRFITDTTLVIGKMNSQKGYPIGHPSDVAEILPWFNETVKERDWIHEYVFRSDSVFFTDVTIEPAPVKFVGKVYKDSIVFVVEQINKKITPINQERKRVYKLYKP